MLKTFAVAIAGFVLSLLPGCPSKCNKLCSKSVLCDLHKDKAKCLETCKSKQRKKKDAFERDWALFSRHLDKPCTEFKKAVLDELAKRKKAR